MNYGKSRGSYYTDADGNTLLNFSARHNVLGYNHPDMVAVRGEQRSESLKNRSYDNHINQAINVHEIESDDYAKLKTNILSIAGAEDKEVVFTESSGSLALNLVAIVAREL